MFRSTAEMVYSTGMRHIREILPRVQLSLSWSWESVTFLSDYIAKTCKYEKVWCVFGISENMSPVGECQERKGLFSFSFSSHFACNIEKKILKI